MFNIHTAWKLKANTKTNTASNYLFYSLYRAAVRITPENKEAMTQKVAVYLKRAFTPITNHVKLANGRYSYDTLKALLSTFDNRFFGDQYIKAESFQFGIELTSDQLTSIKELTTALKGLI